MKSRPGGAARRYQGRRLRRTLAVPVAGLLAISAIVIPLVVHAGIEKDGDSSPAHPMAEGGEAIRFGRFPLDQGWAEIYGRNFIDGPGPGTGGISMPEGHCDEEVLFASGYQDKLSTYVSTTEASRTREILGYADADAARSTFGALRDAVASCAVFNDQYSGKVVSSAEVYESIDQANARTGQTTFTFAYTSTGSAPFGVLYQFAIVDDVVYGSNEYGDWTTETASDGAASLNEENAVLISLLSRIKR